MKRFTHGLLHRTKSSDHGVPQTADSPEARAEQAVKAFCESKNNQGEEVTHLPVIVEAAESSPQAAASACHQIRKFLGKDYYKTSHVQYNAVMLLRILNQNPGPSFTRNINDKFVHTVHSLLRDSRDPSVQQIMRETLDTMEHEQSNEPGVKQLVSMWQQMKGFRARVSPAPGAQAPQSQDTRIFQRAQLPAPHELASRIEESRNTAKILMQLIQSTPTEEVLGNDLIKEFADRGQTAQRSIQGYINCDSPAPDDDTLQTLIEVNEQLSLSLSRHQRAVLSARRAAGVTSGGTSPNPEQQAQRSLSIPMAQPNGLPDPSGRLSPVSPVAQTQYTNSFPTQSQQPLVRPTQSAPPDVQKPSENPFADPTPAAAAAAAPTDHFKPPQRPWAYFTNGATPSYMGRQQSAANGITMHGADIAEEPEPGPVHEIDGDSRVDRARGPAGVDTVSVNNEVHRGAVLDDDDDLYSNSPVRERAAYRY